MLLYIIIAAAGFTAIIFRIRWLALKHALKEAAKELHAVTADIQQNRILRMECPQRELEELLMEMNLSLEEIRRERIRYEQKEQQLQKEIENISHDLRTPLTAILGYLDFMDADTMDAQTKESLEVVRRKTQQLNKLVVQFYDLSRLSGGNFQLELKETDLGRKLREQAAGNYKELAIRNLKVDIDIPGHPVIAMADGDAIDRIFANLFQNAVRYAASSLNIKVIEQDNRINVLFENDTDEIDKIEAEHLFDRFYTADHSRSRGGTGLGLSIARCLVEEMDGDISAKVYEKGGKNWLAIVIGF